MTHRLQMKREKFVLHTPKRRDPFSRPHAEPTRQQAENSGSQTQSHLRSILISRQALTVTKKRTW